MLDTLRKMWPFDDGDIVTEPVDRSAMRRLVNDLHYEIVPMSSIEQAISDLPTGAHVSVTCSPVKGIDVTLDYTERLLAMGFRAIPHVSARLVEGPDHAYRLAEWARRHDLAEMFVIAGDAPEAVGPYEGALPFLHDFLSAQPGVRRIGVAGYPDGHGMLARDDVRQALHAKQSMLADAGVDGWVSTQICFDHDTIRAWLHEERTSGMDLPVRLGVPGVVDRARLMSMGTRLGIGTSLRYLSKNRSTVMRLMAPGGYDPTDMVVAFAEEAASLGIEALHSFTFNAVAETRQWQEAIVAGVAG